MRTRNLSNDIFRLKSKENITYLSNAYPNYPITGISWFEATIFCFGLTSFLADGWVYRLPAELEWEYAARGQARRTFPSGETLIKELQVPDVSDYKLAYPVGCFRETTTPKGAEDMIGNVQEWTASLYARYSEGKFYQWNDHWPGNHKFFVTRCGRWVYSPNGIRSTSRSREVPYNSSSIIGFRIVRQLAQK